MEPPIRALVDVRPHPTVVRLDDLEGDESGWITSAYHLTGDVRTHLTSLTRVLSHDTGCGLFLIGQYGSGKSHFLAYVTRELESGHPLSDEVLDDVDTTRPSPTVLPLSLLNYRSELSLEEVVCGALDIDARGGDRRDAWADVAARHPHGLLLIIDELSEFLRSKADHRRFNEDIRYLQFLGERAQGERFWVLAAMQEGIEHTGDLEQGLYRKIRDRYPIRYLLTPTHVRDLVAESLLVKKDGYADAVERLLAETRAALPDAPLDEDAFRAIYPLHPATLELLEEVRDRFSQARGAIDFTVSQLRGDADRCIEPFLDKPWGSLLGPERIIAHFRELFEFQPEFLPLAQRLLPWYEKHLGEVSDKERVQSLVRRVLDLLILVYLSPARTALSVGEAAYWLLFRSMKIDPAKNLAIVERAFGLLVERGRYVVERDDGYALELADDGSQAFERQLEREKDELRDWGDGLFDLIVPLLGRDDFNPFSLPRDEWQTRNVRWHFHDRPCAVWFGDGEPSATSHASLCVRLPWGDAVPASGVWTLVPRRATVGEETVELAALSRLRDRVPRGDLRDRVEKRLSERRDLFQAQVRSAYDDAVAVSPTGASESPPRADLAAGVTRWLERHLQFVMRRRFPSFEDFAPVGRALPEEAYRRFVRFVFERGLGDPDGDDLVQLVREGYLVPMKLLARKSKGYATARSPERHEIVRRVLPLIGAEPAPAVVLEQLAAPAYGLVPDQVRLLLIFLFVLGEIDIVDGSGRSYRERFEDCVDPLEYAKLTAGKSLAADELRDLEALGEGLDLRFPKEWTVLTLRRAIHKLRGSGAGLCDRLGGLLGKLEALDQGATLAAKLREAIGWWSCLGEGGDGGSLDDFAAFREFRAAIGTPAVFLKTLAGIADLPERFDRLLADLERLRHLFAHPVLRGCPIGRLRKGVEELGEPPDLDEPDRLEEWLGRARECYAEYKKEYARHHASYWKERDALEVWDWEPGVLARSRHLGLDRELARLADCRRQADGLRCRELINLDFQPLCACGFDWKDSPLTPRLRELEGLAATVDRAVETFFSRPDVRDGIAGLVDKGLVGDESTRAYVAGKVDRPAGIDLSLLDRHLSGVEVVRDIDVDELLELLRGRTWERAELVEELKRFLTPFGDDVRLRFPPERE